MSKLLIKLKDLNSTKVVRDVDQESKYQMIERVDNIFQTKLKKAIAVLNKNEFCQSKTVNTVFYPNSNQKCWIYLWVGRGGKTVGILDGDNDFVDKLKQMGLDLSDKEIAEIDLLSDEADDILTELNHLLS